MSNFSDYALAVIRNTHAGFMQIYDHPFLLVKVDENFEPSADEVDDDAKSNQTQVTHLRGKTGSFSVLRHNAILYRLYPLARIQNEDTGEIVSITIGRTSDNVIALGATSVSKAHAVIGLAPQGNAMTLTDLGSRNGTTVSGRRLLPHIPISVSFGDPVTMGSLALTLIGAGAVWEMTRAQINTDS